MNRKKLEERWKVVSPARFAHAIRGVRYDDAQSILDFELLLHRPNITPIDIGYIPARKSTAPVTHITMAPDPGQLDVHLVPTPEDLGKAPDYRAPVSDTILGLWETPNAHRVGHHSDEGYGSGDSGPRPVPWKDQNHLEVFQQLGLLCYKKDVINQTNTRKPEASNYVLVKNIYDNSIWVIWNSRPMNSDSGLREPAIDVPRLRHNYAIFPGTEGDMAFRILYGKLADNWTQIPGKGQAIPAFQHVRYRTLSRTPDQTPDPEPVLVSARRTPQGGIRREGDLRSMAPIKPME